MNHTRRRRQVHVRLGNFGALTWFRRRCYGGHQIFADPNRVVFLQIRWKSQEICILTMSFGYFILPWLESTHETYELSKCNLISECGETWRNNPSNDEPDILSSHMPEMRGLHFNRKMTRNPQQILGPITLSVETVSQKKLWDLVRQQSIFFKSACAMNGSTLTWDGTMRRWSVALVKDFILHQAGNAFSTVYQIYSFSVEVV